MDPAYSILKSELSEELINTLSYWQQNTIDHDYGGFFGRINHKNKVVERASKGIILNTRILWSFAAASVHLKSRQYNAITDRAYRYLRDNFIDYDHHGVFWELDCHGLPINKRKQIYAQAFAIYALSAYYTFSKNPEARILAMGLFELIEKHSKDNQKGGYLEAFSEDWGPLEDVRLSNKDMNAEKTMNTHLHILEAYTELLHIYDSASLKSALRSLVQLFQEKFLGNDHHYQLFFDADWNRQSNTVSYGHDIETAWLLMEAAKAIGDEALLEDTRITAIQVINTFMDEAIDEDGAVINEKNLSTGTLDKDRHWWPQVEALIGLSYAFKLTGRQKYTDCSIRIWDFIKTHLIDRKHGEWHFRVDQYGKVYTEEDKVSMWKAPYHTTRACIILNSNQMKKFYTKALAVLTMALLAGCAKDEPEPTDIAEVSIQVNTDTVTEGESASFIFTLSDRLPTAILVNFQLDGSATNGSDYQMLSSSFTIPPNRLTVSLAVESLEDEQEEGTEEVTLTITGTNNEAIGISQHPASIFILDPPPPFRLSPADTRSYMVNANATDETAALFYNLKTLSETKLLIGQQDAFSSFYNDNTGESDIKKTTGSDPGLLGSDFMFITDDQNDETPNNWFFQQEQMIKTDAVEAYDKGMVNAFTWHLREPYEGDHFYTADMTTFQKENAFKSILPGGANHDWYKAKLDKVAEVAQSMVGGDGKAIPFIFRPFHEFDGHWFWWGKDYCSPQEFITVWRFTVEYLRDTKQVNNMLFAFSPDNSFTSQAAYLDRYPGDDYVDILGMDNYGDFNDMGTTGMNNANAKLQIISDLAKDRVKIAALTESCFFVTPGVNNPIPDFYSAYLYNAMTENGVELAFMMFWSNNRDTYCTPTPGQSSVNDFKAFVNKPRTALADDMPDMYSLPGPGQAEDSPNDQTIPLIKYPYLCPCWCYSPTGIRGLRYCLIRQNEYEDHAKTVKSRIIHLASPVLSYSSSLMKNTNKAEDQQAFKQKNGTLSLKNNRDKNKIKCLVTDSEQGVAISVQKCQHLPTLSCDSQELEIILKNDSQNNHYTTVFTIDFYSSVKPAEQRHSWRQHDSFQNNQPKLREDLLYFWNSSRFWEIIF